MLAMNPRNLILPIILLCVACGGGNGTADPETETPVQFDPPPEPRATASQPPVEAEVIGLPGQVVPGLDATYVTTMLGWLAPEGDVVFEAVIQWSADKSLGCGILRREPGGSVHTLLMQGQPLAGTGGGHVKHPKLPLETRGDTLVMPADVEGGDIEHGLFAVPRTGGEPRLLAAGLFVAATATPDGTVLALREDQGGFSVISISPQAPAEILCPDCDAGFSTDGTCVVVKKSNVAWVIEMDGSTRRLIGLDDVVPGTAGVVTFIRGAWVNDAGAFVVHIQTSDDECPEALLRIGDEIEVLARCGSPAPGTQDVIERIGVASGRSHDVVFTAGTAKSGTLIYCARPGEGPVVVARGDSSLRVHDADVVADGPQIVFGAALLEQGIVAQEAVYRVRAGEAPERIMSTDADVPAAGNARLTRLFVPVREGADVSSDGTAIVHAGVVQARRPDATLGVLLLVR